MGVSSLPRAVYVTVLTSDCREKRGEEVSAHSIALSSGGRLGHIHVSVGAEFKKNTRELFLNSSRDQLPCYFVGGCLSMTGAGAAPHLMIATWMQHVFQCF